MEDKILEKVITFIEGIIEILEKQYKLLELQGYGTQNITDLKQGQVLRKGIIVPFKYIEHYLLFDHYEQPVVQSLIELQKNILKERESPFIGFSLRTLYDIGINRINILFANDVKLADKNHLKLLTSLIDFASTDNPLFTEYFIKLFGAEKTNLTKEEFNLLENIISLIKSGDKITLMDKLIQARWMLSDAEKKILKKIKPLPLLDKVNFRSMYSWRSHMLHGNPFLIQNVFDTKKKEREKLKAIVVLMFTGLNAINRLAVHLNDPRIQLEVKNKNSEIDTLWTSFINFSKKLF